MDDKMLDGKEGLGELRNKGHTEPKRGWRQYSLLNLKGLGNRAFSLNISNITDLIRLILYLDNFRCCKVLLNIQPKSASPYFLPSCPDSSFLEMQMEHNYFATDQPFNNLKTVVTFP